MTMIPDDPTRVKNIFIDKVFFKEIKILAGTKVQTHKHNYDHGMVIAMGHVEVTIEGKTKDWFAPDVIPIRKGKAHSIKAMSNSCLYCVHAIPEDLVDENDIDKVLIEG